MKSFQPIPLATDLEMLEGSYSGCTESGWSQQDRHLKLQKSNITILDTEKCQSEAEDGDQVPDTSFCGGTTNYYTGYKFSVHFQQMLHIQFLMFCSCNVSWLHWKSCYM